MKENISGCFNDDQLEALKKTKSSTANRWTNETVMKALKIRCATGAKGYNFIRSLGIPLPSYRTLCNRMVGLQLGPGIQSIILDWMGLKMTGLHLFERHCCLLLDEVQISKAVEYDHSLHSFVGYVNREFPSTDDVASHVLCFMAKGVSTKWKQLIAYFYTGATMGGNSLWNMTKQIVCELRARGLIACCIVSDMAASNQAMWRAAGISSGREEVSCSIQHPADNDYNLHFMADVPHLLKNLRTSFLKHNIRIPIQFVDRYRLSTEEVSSTHVKAIIRFQEEKQLKLAPKLTMRHLSPSQYEKMRVGMAAQVLSHSTSSAIRTLVRMGELPPSAETTAFFCEYMNTWFDLMNCRQPAYALHAHSDRKINQLLEAMGLWSLCRI